MATGILESVRPKGVELLDVILDKVNSDDLVIVLKAFAGWRMNA